MVSGNFANRVRQVLSRRDNSGLEVMAEDVGGATQAFLVSNNDDLFAVINDALDKAGQDGKVTVENDRYLKSTGKAVSTKLTTSAEGQTIDFQGSDIEQADGADLNEMIILAHDSIKMVDVNFQGNRNNNSINQVITNDGGEVDITLEDVEVSGAPDGILFDNITNASIINTGTTKENQNVDNSIKISNSTDTTILGTKLSGFKTNGLFLENSDSILTRALDIIPQSGVGATNGIKAVGLRDSVIGGTINAGGELDKGVRDEAFDVGGDDRFSTANVFDLVVNGVNDIGFDIEDAEKERIRGFVDGSKPTGRTTQAFLVTDPNNLEPPQHNIDVSGRTLTRVTDTDMTDANDGMRIEGHYFKVNNTATYGAGGSSTTDFTFGQSMPNPVLNIQSGTTVRYQETSVKTTTDNNGQVSLDWSDDYAFVDKPILTVTLEQAGQWHVASFGTDGSGRFTDATIQVTDSSGTAVGNGVETNVKIVGV